MNEINDNKLLQDVQVIVETGKNVVYRSVNAAMLMTYWKIGERIVMEEQDGSARAEYGKRLISQLAKDLTNIYGKGYSARSLREYRQFYLTFPEKDFWRTCAPNLTWSHFRRIMQVVERNARQWYLKEAAEQTWSVRTLDRNISTQYYERLLLSQHKELVEKEMLEKTAIYQEDKLEFIKNPVVAEFLGLAPNSDFTETELEQSILTHIQKFLMEMGKGYAFVARQQHIRTQTDDFFIDLVFYNYILKCFILIDLKCGKVTHQDVGQMDMYVRMYDDLKRGETDNPTMGIILCSQTDETIARYSVLHDSEQFFATKYKLCLPDEKDLRREIELQKEIFRLQHSNDETDE